MSREDDGPVFRGPLEAVLRHPILALIPVLLLVGAGAAVGLLRDPEYSAEARISVGRINVPAYTLQGVIIGNATLAASYSRAVQAPSVIRRAAREARLSVVDAYNNVSASQVPQSTLIRVESTAGTREQAQALANGAATGLIDYVTRLSVEQQEQGTLRRYRRAQRRTDYQRAHLAAVEAKVDRDPAEIEEARLDLLTAQLRSQSLSTRVVQGMVGGTIAAPPQNLLQLVVPATRTESDFSSVLQRMLLIGLAAGIVLGAGLAVLRANRSLLRRSRS